MATMTKKKPAKGRKGGTSGKGHGGRREGAGRKPEHREMLVTFSVSVPMSLAVALTDYAENVLGVSRSRAFSKLAWAGLTQAGYDVPEPPA